MEELDTSMIFHKYTKKGNVIYFDQSTDTGIFIKVSNKLKVEVFKFVGHKNISNFVEH